MTPLDALARLRTDPGEAAAWRSVRQELDRLVRGVTSDSWRWPQVAAKVLAGLEDRAISGDLPEIRSPAAYLRRALTWRLRDQIRREEAEKRALERRPGEATVAEPSVMLLDPDAFEALQPVFNRARARREPHQRAHLDRAWPQILRLHTEPVTLPQLAMEEEGISADEPEQVRLACQRMHKAHARCRQALGEALDWMIERRLVDPDEASELQESIERLRRCPPPRSRRVSSTDGENNEP